MFSLKDLVEHRYKIEGGRGGGLIFFLRPCWVRLDGVLYRSVGLELPQVLGI